MAEVWSRLAYAGWSLAAAGAERRFRRALANPGGAQEALLAGILRANADTDAGRRFGFAGISTFDAYRRAVPIQHYEELSPAIDAIRAGRRGVLTAEPVRRLLPTSGSSGARKLLPFTAAFGRALQAAIGPWLRDLLRRYPAIAGGPAYWALSPNVAIDEPSTVPIGFESDARYLGALLEPLVAKVLVAPEGLRKAATLDGWAYATLLLLLSERELRLISVWHPSFFTLLWSAREGLWERLLADLERGRCDPPSPLGAAAEAAVARRLRPSPARARELRALGPEAPAAEVWPRLALFSAWADALAAGPAAALAKELAPVPFQAKGLFATEAFVSLPYAGKRPLAVTSHVFEFLDGAGRSHLAHQLERGGRYQVLLTTQAGLYRYRLGDQVEVEDVLENTPCLRFLGRGDAVVDLVGEKLDDAFVTAALAAVLESQGSSFAMLAPTGAAARTGYTLFLDSDVREPRRVAHRLEAALRENPHYAWAADLGQLAPLRVFVVAGDAHAAYLRAEGQKRELGGIKSRALDRRGDWSERLPGAYLPDAEDD